MSVLLSFYDVEVFVDVVASVLGSDELNEIELIDDDHRLDHRLFRIRLTSLK